MGYNKIPMEQKLLVTVIKAESGAHKSDEDKGQLKRKISQVSDILFRKPSNDIESSGKAREPSPTKENLLTSDLIIHPPSYGTFTAELQLKHFIGNEKKQIVVKVHNTKLEILLAKNEDVSNEKLNEEIKEVLLEKENRSDAGFRINLLQKLRKRSTEKENVKDQKQNGPIEEKHFTVHGYIPLPNYIHSETLEFSMNFFGNLYIEAKIKGAITMQQQFRRKTFQLDNGPLHERIAKQVSECARNSPVLRKLNNVRNSGEGQRRNSLAGDVKKTYFRQISAPAHKTKEYSDRAGRRRMTVDIAEKITLNELRIQKSDLIPSATIMKKSLDNNTNKKIPFRRLFKKISKERQRNDKTAQSPGAKCRGLAKQVLINHCPSPSHEKASLKQRSTVRSCSPLLKKVMLKNLSSKISASKSNKSEISLKNTADYKLFVSSENVANSPSLSSRMSKGTTACKGVFKPWGSLGGKGSKGIKKSCTWELRSSSMESALQATSFVGINIMNDRDLVVYRHSKSLD